MPEVPRAASGGLVALAHTSHRAPRVHEPGSDVVTPTTTKNTEVDESEAAAAPAARADDGRSDSLVVEDLLVEDVSIDGMCGVY
jgi:mycofactocin precursor